MTPIVDGLEEQYQDRVAVRRLDANQGDGPEIIRQHKILGHPTILLIDQAGQERGRLVGPQAQEAVADLLEQLLAATGP